MDKRKFTIRIAATSLAVAASLTMAAAPASAAPAPTSTLAASHQTVPNAEWSITWMPEGDSFRLGGYGTAGSTVELLDSTNTVVQSTTTGDDEVWWLDGGAKDGFGGTVTIRQVVDGTVTDSLTVDLADIPWP